MLSAAWLLACCERGCNAGWTTAKQCQPPALAELLSTSMVELYPTFPNLQQWHSLYQYSTSSSVPLECVLRLLDPLPIEAAKVRTSIWLVSISKSCQEGQIQPVKFKLRLTRLRQLSGSLEICSKLTLVQSRYLLTQLQSIVCFHKGGQHLSSGEDLQHSYIEKLVSKI